MKSIILSFIILIGTTSWARSSNAVSGPSTSGGGVGVLCSSPQGKQLFTLDIFELIMSGRKPFATQGKGTELDFWKAWMNIRSFTSSPWAAPVEKIHPKDAEWLKKTMSQIRFVDKPLPPTNDIGRTRPLPDGCEYQQIGIYYDPQGLVLNKSLWEQLDSVNQAALITHELIYWGDRIGPVRDSQNTRRLVAEAFAQDGMKMKGLLDGVRKGIGYECMARDPKTGYHAIFVWQGRKFYFLNILGAPLYAQSTIDVPLSHDQVRLSQHPVEGWFGSGLQILDLAGESVSFRGAKVKSDLPVKHVIVGVQMIRGNVFAIGLENPRTVGQLFSKPVVLPVTNCMPFNGLRVPEQR